MPKKRLTEQNVLSLNVPGKLTATRWWDFGPDAVHGLHVLAQKKTGTRSYRVTYRYPGSSKDRHKLLGRVGYMTLQEARTKALAIRKAVARGDDPDACDPLNGDTFKVCVEKWSDQEQVGRKECISAQTTKTYLLNATKRWHDRAIGTLRYSEIEDLLFTVRKRAPYSSLRLHAHLATLFRWSVRTKRVTTNPMAEMPPPWLGAKRRQRDWFKGEKTDAMIKALWQAADQLGGNDGKFCKLVILLGKRKVALATMDWSHIDASYYWTPTCGNKVKRCHPMPLPKLVQRIIGPKHAEGRVLGKVIPETLIVTVRKMTGIDDLIWHGCRHVMESKLAALKILPHLRDMLMDHSPNRGSGAEYDHYEYRAEQLEALETWCAHVERLVQPDAAVAVLR